MKVSEFIKEVHEEYQGDTEYPARDGADGQHSLYLSTANRLLRIFRTQPNNKSRSGWEERELGEVSSERVVDLDSEIWALSDFIYIDKPDGSTVRFDPVDLTAREGATNCFYVSGMNPQKITFTGTGDMSADLIGGTIRAGCYIYPKTLKNDNDFVGINRPMWLVYATAASLARNDPAKANQFPNLNGLANDEWKMAAREQRNTQAGQSRKVRRGGSRLRRRY